MNRFFWLFSLFALLVLLSGCGSDNPATGQNPKDENNPKPEPVTEKKPVRSPAAADFLHGSWIGEGNVEPIRMASIRSDFKGDQKFLKGEITRCVVRVKIEQSADELAFTEIEMTMPDDDRLRHFQASVIRSFVKNGRRQSYDPMRFDLRQAASDENLRYLLRHRKNGSVSDRPLNNSLIDLAAHSMMIGEVKGPYKGTHKDGRILSGKTRRTLMMSADGGTASGTFMLSRYNKKAKRYQADARCDDIQFRRQ